MILDRIQGNHSNTNVHNNSLGSRLFVGVPYCSMNEWMMHSAMLTICFPDLIVTRTCKFEIQRELDLLL
jgi:hypothetical protein